MSTEAPRKCIIEGRVLHALQGTLQPGVSPVLVQPKPGSPITQLVALPPSLGIGLGAGAWVRIEVERSPGVGNYQVNQLWAVQEPKEQTGVSARATLPQNDKSYPSGGTENEPCRHGEVDEHKPNDLYSGNVVAGQVCRSCRAVRTKYQHQRESVWGPWAPPPTPVVPTPGTPQNAGTAPAEPCPAVDVENALKRAAEATQLPKNPLFAQQFNHPGYDPTNAAKVPTPQPVGAGPRPEERMFSGAFTVDSYRVVKANGAVLLSKLMVESLGESQLDLSELVVRGVDLTPPPGKRLRVKVQVTTELVDG